MMYSPIAYSNYLLFSFLLRDIMISPQSDELSSKTTSYDWSHPALRLLAPPTPTERAEFDATRKEEGWGPRKRLIVALHHFVYWSSFIDLYADMTYRVEDTPATFVCAQVPQLSSLCGTGDSSRGRADGKHHTNSHEIIPELKSISWANLCNLAPNMTRRALELGYRYGYQFDYLKDGC